MAYKTKIYLRGVKNLAEARFAAATGIDYVGFQLNTSLENALSLESAKEIKNWISGPESVACFGSVPAGTIKDANEVLVLNAFEVPLSSIAGKEKVIGLKPFIHSHIGEIGNIKDDMNCYALVISQNPAKRLYFDDLLMNEKLSRLIRQICLMYRVYFDLGFSVEDNLELLDFFNPEGLVVNSESEEKTGIQDFSKIQDFLDKLEC